jgi:phosphatidate cytidylyltransferase
VNIIKFFSNPRVWVATIFLSITLVSIIIGKLALALFLAVLIYLGSKEYVTLARAKGLNPSLKIILIVDFFLIFFATLQSFDRSSQFIKHYDFLGLVVTFGVIATFIKMLFRGAKATLNDTAATILGFMYGGWLPMHIILLRNLYKSGIYLFHWHVREGLGYIVLIFFVISLSDIAAYYVGKTFGKNKLWPEISPNKTKEGALAGAVGGILGAVLVGHFIEISLFHSLVSGLLLSIAAQYGDLAESMMKRDAGVKDSGTLLPGHGGVLDRADSYIFTGAVAYYYFSLFVIGNTIM